MPRDPARPDVYARVTHAIIADLEAGVRPWTKPWTAPAGRGGPVSRPLRAGGQPYSGVNVLILWSAALAGGFAAPTWMTFRQAQALGGQVRRGEHGATVVYANRIRRTEADGAGGEVERSIPFLKTYTVFNVEQVDNLPDAFQTPGLVVSASRRIERAHRFFEATGARVRYGGDQAYYAPGPDHIQMPVESSFPDPVDFYATLGHETVHWTAHPTRLNRDFGRKRWGDAGYAREELVAELGAAFLCADLGLDLRPRRDHADYIADWLQVLQQDKRFIFSAAAFAQKACDHLHGLQPKDQEDDADADSPDAVARRWAALSDDEQHEIIADYDDLDAQGRLGDVAFHRQWIARRMPGYVGD